MAQTPNQDAQQAASTAGRPAGAQAQANAAQNKDAAQGNAATQGNSSAPRKATAQGKPAPQNAATSAAGHASAAQDTPASGAAAQRGNSDAATQAQRRPLQKQAPQQRTFLAQTPPADEPQDKKRAGKAGLGKAAKGGKSEQNAPQAAAKTAKSAKAEPPAQSTANKQAGGLKADANAAPKAASAAATNSVAAASTDTGTNANTASAARATPPAPRRARLPEAPPPKARPRPHTDAVRANAADAKERATRNTVPLHSTAILQLEQIARSMQRGVNDGALVEAEGAARLPFRLVINALGQILYRIGLQCEYAVMRFLRTVKRGFHLLAMGILLLLRTFLRPIGALFAGIWRDLSAPFVRLFLGVRHAFKIMHDATGRGESGFAAALAYAKQGFKTYRHVGATALSYLLPLTAAAILALTVWSVLDTPFSLAVTYNDKMIGYVESEAVWESAKKRVADRIRASSPDETFDARPQFNVVSVQVDARRDVLDMVDVIISESSDQIQNATGVYIGDTLAGICTDGAGVQQMLDTTLAAALPQDDPTARVEFVNSVTTEAGLYFTDSISTLTQLESTLQANNWLQVKLMRTEVRNEAIAFESVEEENPNAYKGSTRVKQRGVDGEKVVTDDVSYINGVEIDRVTLSEEIIKEPVPRITTVGTKQSGGSYTGSVIQGSGVLIWPVPNYAYTTTEFGGHRGLDICAPYGSEVLACDGGTVVEAGWHWSWGNYILIDHGNGITTRYAHNSQLNVTLGQNVAQYQPIALVGSTGTSSGNHCHLEVTVNGHLVNPRLYLP